MRRVLLSMLMIVLAASGVLACGQGGKCAITDGYYRALLPPGYDGQAPLPVLLHFHGYRENSAELVAREDLRAISARLGAVLVIPQGEGDTWSHPGSPAAMRDEFAYVDALMADLFRRYPVDRDRILVSGFSQGAAMVWNLACRQGSHFTGFLAISGTFWQPQPDACPDMARNLMQVHGVADRIVPIEGRAIRDRFRQGDVFRAMGMARLANRCQPDRASAARIGALICEEAGGCAGEARLSLCLHPNGHDFDPAWLETAFRRFFPAPSP